MPTTNEMITALWARSQIEAVMLRFGRALDLGDWKAYRSCFADRFKVNFERLTGQPEVYVDADLWTRFAEIILSPVRRHHQYSNLDRNGPRRHRRGGHLHGRTPLEGNRWRLAGVHA